MVVEQGAGGGGQEGAAAVEGPDGAGEQVAQARVVAPRELVVDGPGGGEQVAAAGGGVGAGLQGQDVAEGVGVEGLGGEGGVSDGGVGAGVVVVVGCGEGRESRYVLTDARDEYRVGRSCWGVFESLASRMCTDTGIN